MQALTETEKQELHDHALAADRLRQDPAFQRAIIALRKEALEALVSADPDDAQTIRTHQANIRAIDNLCGEIAMTILRAPRKSEAVA